jgi:hypothetical protein
VHKKSVGCNLTNWMAVLYDGALGAQATIVKEILMKRSHESKSKETDPTISTPGKGVDACAVCDLSADVVAKGRTRSV